MGNFHRFKKEVLDQQIGPRFKAFLKIYVIAGSAALLALAIMTALSVQ